MPLQNSTDRILTTHTGSLPRTPELTALLVARDQGKPYDADALREETAAVLARTVDAQLDAAAGVGDVGGGVGRGTGTAEPHRVAAARRGRSMTG